MFMKRNRNVGRRVVYPHILEGARKDLQDHAGHEFEREDKLYQVSNEFKLSTPHFRLRSANILAQELQDLKCLGGEGMLKFRVNRRITANSK